MHKVHEIQYIKDWTIKLSIWLDRNPIILSFDLNETFLLRLKRINYC